VKTMINYHPFQMDGECRSSLLTSQNRIWNLRVRQSDGDGMLTSRFRYLL
jgi:hypothetical protein